MSESTAERNLICTQWTKYLLARFMLRFGRRVQTKKATSDRMLLQKLTYGCKMGWKSVISKKSKHMLKDRSPECDFGVKLRVKGESKMDQFWLSKWIISASTIRMPPELRNVRKGQPESDQWAPKTDQKYAKMKHHIIDDFAAIYYTLLRFRVCRNDKTPL